MKIAIVLGELIELELNRHSDYLAGLRDRIAEEEVSLHARLRGLMEGLPEQDAEDLIDHYLDDIQNWRRGFPELFERSSYVAIYSAIEHGLGELADHLERADPKAQRLRSFARGRSLSYSELRISYMEAVHAVATAEVADARSRLDDHRVIRNVVTHAGANVMGSREEVRARAVASACPKLFSLDDRGSLSVHRHASNDLVKTGVRLVKGLAAAVANVT